MDESSKQSVCQFVRGKMPKPCGLFSFPDLLIVSEEIALLGEVCKIHECFSMSPAVLEPLSEIQVSAKHCENDAYIASSLYAFTIEDLKNLVPVYEEDKKRESQLIILTSLYIYYQISTMFADKLQIWHDILAIMQLIK